MYGMYQVDDPLFLAKPGKSLAGYISRLEIERCIDMR
jgi:hypothetical protein